MGIQFGHGIVMILFLSNRRSLLPSRCTPQIHDADGPLIRRVPFANSDLEQHRSFSSFGIHLSAALEKFGVMRCAAS